MKLTVGQTVYISDPNYKGKLREGKVTKVGTKWVHFDSGQRAALGSRQIDRDTGVGGLIYSSLAEFEEITALEKSWGEFRRTVDTQWRRPEGVSLEDIQAARKLLKLETT